MESIARRKIYISVCKYFIFLPYIVSIDSSKQETKQKKADAYFLAAKFTLQSKAICKTLTVSSS